MISESQATTDAQLAEVAASQPGGPRRVVIDDIRPHVDGGRYPIKRIVGDRVTIEVDLLSDGHDRLAGVLLYRRRGQPSWVELPLEGPEEATAASAKSAAAPKRTTAAAARTAATTAPVAKRTKHPGNDVWRATFTVDALGTWEYSASGWIDVWATWSSKLEKKMAAAQDVEQDLRAGAALVAAAAGRASGEARVSLRRLSEVLGGKGDSATRAAAALDPSAEETMRAYADRAAATEYHPPLAITVDPPRAGFSSWYELFPRSCAAVPAPAAQAGAEPPVHGTFKDAEGQLQAIADMGFDVLYLPPIHPIGRTNRKGPNNSLSAGPHDPGSPWAVGASEGGHKAIHPELGTLADFQHFVQAARSRGLEVALDVAFQASPDHPYVREHPEWFVHRPDGAIQYAENPPKKYEDIYPFDFTGPAWDTLWIELRSVFLHWIAQGVRIFRVDNPHTKPITFWEWCIASIKERHPEVIFLAEAFTRPKLMHVLAKVGFSQSYTYFTWRTTKAELTTYVRSIADSDIKEFFRPNFWPNTPDILPEHLQFGTRGTFIARAVLAATLSPNWGIYGPVYELCERVARDGSEEYTQSEKYEIRVWDRARPDSLAPVLRRLNQIRLGNPALQRMGGTIFHPTDNESLICYSRADEDQENVVLVVVNLDPHNRHTGWLTLNLPALGLSVRDHFQVHDLMGDARYLWRDGRAFVSLDPQVMPAHVFRIRRRVHTEQTFEYYQ